MTQRVSECTSAIVRSCNRQVFKRPLQHPSLLPSLKCASRLHPICWDLTMLSLNLSRTVHKSIFAVLYYFCFGHHECCRLLYDELMVCSLSEDKCLQMTKCDCKSHLVSCNIINLYFFPEQAGRGPEGWHDRYGLSVQFLLLFSVLETYSDHLQYILKCPVYKNMNILPNIEKSISVLFVVIIIWMMLLEWRFYLCSLLLFHICHPTSITLVTMALNVVTRASFSKELKGAHRRSHVWHVPPCVLCRFKARSGGGLDITTGSSGLIPEDVGYRPGVRPGQESGTGSVRMLIIHIDSHTLHAQAGM